MGDRTRKGHYHGLIPGLALLAIGLFFLGINFGWWSALAIRTIAHFWPLLFILLGLRLLIANDAIFSLLILLGVATILVVARYAPQNVRKVINNPRTSVYVDSKVVSNQHLSSQLGDVKSLVFTLNLGLANVRVADLPADSKALFVADFVNTGNIDQQSHSDNGASTVTMKQADGSWTFKGDRHATVTLPRTIPINLSVKTGASQVSLDTSNLVLSALHLEAGASNSTVKLGRPSGEVAASFDTGAAHLKLQLPKDVAIEIKLNAGLFSDNFTNVGLTKDGDIYKTANYDSATDKYTVTIDGGASVMSLDFY